MKYFPAVAACTAYFLTAGLSTALAQKPVDPVEPLLANASIKQGEQAFLVCRACHSAAAGTAPKIGPNLWGLINREIASQPDFAYSEALRKLIGSWNYAALNEYLLDPGAYAPGTLMVYPGIKDTAMRANVIAYLRTLSDSMAPLPETDSTSRSPVSARPGKDIFGSDWPLGQGRELTGHICNACHSLAIVKQQGLSRDSWDELLDWMVEEQGMDELGDEQREKLLNFLATHFGLSANG